MREPASHVVYEFGNFRLDAGRRLLFAKGAPDPLDVAPKVLETILYFLERPGELLEKEELMIGLWPSRVVEENNLTQAISVARRVLGEARGEHRYFATLPGRGYRFVADVTRRSIAPGPARTAPALEPVANSAERVRRAQLVQYVAWPACVLGAALLAYRWYGESPGEPPYLPICSIAVLPFVDMSPEQDHEYFSAGLSEELLNLLTQRLALLKLRVVAGPSAFSLEGQNVDIATTAAKLNVAYVLSGSIRTSGERVRITVALVDAANRSHVWSEIYDRELDDVIAVQIEIAALVTEALKGTLVDGELPRIDAPSGNRAATAGCRSA